MPKLNIPGLGSQIDFDENIIGRSFSVVDELFRRGNVSLELEIFQRLFVPGDKLTLLDICCGRGRAIEEFTRIAEGMAVRMDRQRLIKGIGVDVNNIWNVDQRNSEFRQGDARELPVESGTVDIAYSVASMYLIPETLRALEEVCRVLEPGSGVGFLHGLRTDFALNPNLDSIFDATPGARDNFQYVDLDCGGEPSGFLVCRNVSTDFKGFPFEARSGGHGVDSGELRGINSVTQGKLYSCVGEL